MRAQVQVMWGNTLFEQSQMRARLGKEWRPSSTSPSKSLKGRGAQRRTSSRRSRFTAACAPRRKRDEFLKKSRREEIRFGLRDVINRLKF